MLLILIFLHQRLTQVISVKFHFSLENHSWVTTTEETL